MSKQEQSVNNLLYFEASSMKELHQCMKRWQENNKHFFLNLSIQRDDGNFCCIATINPESLKQQIQKSEYEEAMARFERKALRVIVKEKNTGAIVEFVDPIISVQKILAIQKRLMECTTAMEIRTVFEKER